MRPRSRRRRVAGLPHHDRAAEAGRAGRPRRGRRPAAQRVHTANALLARRLRVPVISRTAATRRPPWPAAPGARPRTSTCWSGRCYGGPPFGWRSPTSRRATWTRSERVGRPSFPTASSRLPATWTAPRSAVSSARPHRPVAAVRRPPGHPPQGAGRAPGRRRRGVGLAPGGGRPGRPRRTRMASRPRRGARHAVPPRRGRATAGTGPPRGVRRRRLLRPDLPMGGAAHRLARGAVPRRPGGGEPGG